MLVQTIGRSRTRNQLAVLEGGKKHVHAGPPIALLG